MFKDLIDLASERLGGSVLYANDDFFAEKENLLKPAKAIWKEHEYTDRGKWMDGWESRRKRVGGHDFAIIRLGARGIVRGVVVDTSFFRGNYPESCSIEAASARIDASVEQLLAAEWRELLPRSPLQGDSENEFEVASGVAVTHLRFNIFPDGGVARLRVHGEIVPEWRLAGGLANEIDLAAVENGGDVITCSDMFFGPKHNLIMPGRAHNMSDGWETRRRRGPGYDWVVVKLATEGRIRRIEIDTNHFKGNYPDTASIEGARDGDVWTELLPRTKLQAHTRHYFIDELLTDEPFTHLRLNVYPDGGVSRLRVWGLATENGRRAAVVQRVNTLFHGHELRKVCASSRWVDAMMNARPFASWDALVDHATRLWLALDAADWLEAFSAHPRIGERRAGWSSQEQSGTRTASDETMAALAEGNRAYEEKFGFVYLVCATGRSADDMLANLRGRINNDRETELRIAAEEHAKITALRLEKLVN
ncbi:MAG TPA: allantoicase [Thermoanaerobaculia bacterium]|nr:allantoicase [Thermoanaerobaculia bacterium]